MEITHEVFNQPEPLVNYNLFEGNRALQDALQFNAPGLDTTALRQLGATLGRAEMQAHARLANIHKPELHTHDRFGRRIDQVEFHSSYHALMALAVGAGLHGAPRAISSGGDDVRRAGPSQASTAPSGGSAVCEATSVGAHVERAAGFMLFTELEPSSLCPISMSYAVTPALRGNPAIHADWAPGLTSRLYDPALKIWRDKPGLTMGM
ncbi:MAG: DNA alkylation response protein, partial [Polaromonas sp.]